jgi:hypothetical protein
MEKQVFLEIKSDNQNQILMFNSRLLITKYCNLVLPTLTKNFEESYIEKIDRWRKNWPLMADTFRRKETESSKIQLSMPY